MSCIAGSNTWYRPLPASFAMYIATSALRRSSSAPSGPLIRIGVGRCDTDRRADEHLLALEVERTVEAGQDPRRDLGRVDAVAVALEQDRELVAAETRRRVGLAQRRLDAVADLAEQAVAGGVAERVVDRLEVVQVHEQDRHGLAVATLALEGVLDAVLEQGPVGEAGDRVVERLVRELLLERLALGDVAGVQDDALDVLVVEQVRAQRLDVEPEVVAVAHAPLGERRVSVAFATSPAREELEHLRLVLGVDQGDEPRLPSSSAAE